MSFSALWSHIAQHAAAGTVLARVLVHAQLRSPMLSIPRRCTLLVGVVPESVPSAFCRHLVCIAI